MWGDMLTPEFWRGKQVFVTGHTGFKGTWLCLLLERLGAHVSGYALEPPSSPSLFQLAGVADRIDSVHGDIRDFDKLHQTIRERRPEIVIHMAAQALVRRSYRDPIENYSTNVMGTVHLLEAVRRVGSPRVVINVTSDKCYQNREMIWGYRETDAMGGHDPYSSSKGCAELVADAYRNSYFTPKQGESLPILCSVRAGNVIGGGDWAEDRLIPDCIRSLSKNEAVLIRSPHAIRPWQLVLEPLEGYLTLAEKAWDGGSEYAGGWNFGPRDSDAQPVRQIVERIVSLWGPGARWTLSDGPHPHEAHYLKLDCTKSRAKLDWEARTNLALALDWIVDWYRDVGRGKNAYHVSHETLDRFLSLERPSTWTSPDSPRTPWPLPQHPAAVFAKAS
jgi:CDP-glucose 4,6-dehydratase